jgi:hypothetical protein
VFGWSLFGACFAGGVFVVGDFERESGWGQGACFWPCGFWLFASIGLIMFYFILF